MIFSVGLFPKKERKALSGAKLPAELKAGFQLSQKRALSGASAKISREAKDKLLAELKLTFDEINQALREVDTELTTELDFGGAKVKLLGEGAWAPFQNKFETIVSAPFEEVKIDNFMSIKAQWAERENHLLLKTF